MGNRAVIVAHDTNRNNQDKRIGIYLHWFGSEDSIKDFMQMAKNKKIRGVDSDPQYCWARLTQIIADYISDGGDDECSIGIGIVRNLDTFNYDNGVYYIDEDFNVVKHTDGFEFKEHSKEDDLLHLPKEEYLDLYGVTSEEYDFLQKNFQEI